MLTVISETVVKQGRETDWDAAYRERAADARLQDGWVELQLLVPLEESQRRLVVGTWRDREAWERWHDTDTFKATRDQLDAATEKDGDETWFSVVEDEHAG
jgi:heme-degrading monooxygenase HmoA